MRRVPFAAFAPSVMCAVIVAAAVVAAAQDEPAQSSDVGDLLRRAAIAANEQQFDEAEALLRMALDADPKSVAATVALGGHLCEYAGGAEGIGLLYHAVELDPKSVAATVALIDELLLRRDAAFDEGDTSSADSNLARASDVLARALDKEGLDAPELTLRRIRVLIRGEDGAKLAYELAQKLVASDPQNQDFHAALVEASTAAKEFAAALAHYESGPYEPWLKVWFMGTIRAARATWRFNHFDDDEQSVADFLEAEKLMLEAGRLNPEIFDAASERASFDRSWAGWVRFTRQQRTEEAWDLFVSAWGRWPGNANAIEGMSWACQRLYEAGELEKTREFSRQLCVIAPERSDFWNNYALVCRDTGQYEESFRAYRRAMTLAPDDGRVVNDCALILLYHLHRDLDLCERWLFRAEDLAREALAAAIRAEDEGRINEQRGVVGDALVNLARLYAGQGRMQESAQEWSELRELDPGRTELPENGAEANLPPAAAPADPAGDEPAEEEAGDEPVDGDGEKPDDEGGKPDDGG